MFCFGPQCFLHPQLQIIFCYIARYYVKKIEPDPAGRKERSPLSWGAKQNRSDFSIVLLLVSFHYGKDGSDFLFGCAYLELVSWSWSLGVVSFCF